MLTIGLLHPGAMGASVGAALVAAGHCVRWAAAGRSEATRKRAARAKLLEADDVALVVRESEWIVCVCPPDAARDVAEQVLAAGFRGLYVDANAIAPQTARAIGELIEDGGADFVDAGVVGPPAWSSDTTHLHLAGVRAEEVAAAFAGTNVEARVLPGDAGAASALKMAFAGWSKGSTALLANVWALAREAGVHQELLAEWEKFAPDLPGRLRAALPASAPKAWRFAGEMNEIAETYEAAGLPGGFHRAAAEVYQRLASFKDESATVSSDAVADRLRKRG